MLMLRGLLLVLALSVPACAQDLFANLPKPEPEKPEPRRVEVRFENGRGYWDAGYGEKYYAGRLRDGMRFPFQNGGSPALEYRGGYMYWLDGGTSPVAEAPALLPDSRDVVIEYFGASWCPGCRTEKPIIQRLKDSGLNVRMVDVDHSNEYSGTIPCTRIRVGGKITKQWIGYVSGQTIRDAMPKSIEDGTPAAQIDSALDRLPEPEEAFGDLGCGDGRVLVAAWQRWHKPVIGYEIDECRAEQARRNLADVGADYQIIVADVTTLDELPFDVGYVYQFTPVLEKLRPALLKLRAFAAYAHAVPDVTMSRTRDNVYWWTRPDPVEQPGRPAGIAAWYYGAWYTPSNFPTALTCGCEMCQYLRSEWRKQGWRG